MSTGEPTTTRSAPRSGDSRLSSRPITAVAVPAQDPQPGGLSLPYIPFLDSIRTLRARDSAAEIADLESQRDQLRADLAEQRALRRLKASA